MTYFADFTPHTYSPTLGLTVLNVGWLDDGRPFATGPTSQEFRDALLELCRRPILLHRGFHTCWFCKKGAQARLGNGQIRVVSQNGTWYSSPTLVHHYVADHQYSPPPDFVNAVLSPSAVGINYGWHPAAQVMLAEHRRRNRLGR